LNFLENEMDTDLESKRFSNFDKLSVSTVTVQDMLYAGITPTFGVFSRRNYHQKYRFLNGQSL